MKKYYFFWLLICLPLFGGAQTYGNEWINYAQKYYKIKVAKDGIYRVDSLTLAKAGILLGSIDPRNFQLFFRGKEQYIYIQESGGVFNKNSYIEFYGQHNDGFLDSVLYPKGLSTPNPYYSLFSDTSTYYLTWNSSVSNHRMSPQNNVSFPATGASYFIAKTVNVGNYEYYGGRRYLIDGLTTSDPRYTCAEGWFNYELDMGGTQTYNLNISNVYTSGPSAIVKTLFAGESDAGVPNDHQILINASWNVGPPLTNITLTDTFPVVTEQYFAPASKLTGTVSLTFSSLVVAGVPSNITAISYIYAQYPHDLNMGGAGNFMLYVSDTSSGTYLDLSNVGIVNAADTVRFYDLTNHRRIKVVQNTFDTCKVLVPNGWPGEGLKQCYLTSDDSIYKVNQLNAAGVGGTFTDYTPVSRIGIPYIIISNPVLGLQFGGAASNYAAYRSTTGYNVVLANVEELYDQYAYGIEKNPLAIRNFCDYAIHKWRTPPQYLFLLGKGIHAPLCRPDTARNGYADELVPSMGYPSSDVLLTAGLTGNSLKPGLATGRLAVTNAAEINTYLGKVNTYETTPPAQWMKKVVHFGGGADAAEQATILGYLNNYASIIENPYYGADVYTFLKTTAAPIQLTLADSVAQLINNGVSIMTFFGHASGANFDINLDAPGNYSNYGKYPLIIANACFSGDIFQPEGAAVSSTSEQFVLDQKGSIGFIATDDLGIENYLYTYTSQFYTDVAKQMYRKPIGLCLQNTVATVQSPTDLFMVMTCLEMTLHGDPGIVLLAHDSLPDYAVTDSSVYFSPNNVTTQVDSFKVYVVVSNLGEALNQPVQLSVTRTFPNGSTVNYLKTFNHIYYQDTVSITMPVNNISGVGLNQFAVDVDPSNLLKEMTKNNNQLLRPAVLWITSGDIVPVYPYQFAIIPTDTVTLKASTGDPNAPLRKYIFQIDTSGLFNSPWLKSQEVSSKGGVVCAGSQYWVNTPPIISRGGGPSNNSNSHRMLGNRLKGLPLTFTDSTVYFWRVMRDTNDTKDFFWQNSSFQYIRGKTGWGQSNYYQFVNNQYNYIIPKVANRNWIFSPVGRTLQCFNYGVPPSQIYSFATQLYATRYVMDLTIQAYAGCTAVPAIMVAVIDPVSLQPWSNSNYNFSNMNDPGNPYACHVPDNKFIFWYNDNTQMAGLDRMLNAVPKNDYILVYSWLQAGFQHWADSTAVKTDFKNLDPSLNLTGKADTVPWIFFVQKGNPTSARSIIGSSDTAYIQFTTTLSSNNDFGTITTPIIGPAQKWDSLSWKQFMSNPKDSVRLNVIGLDVNYNPKTLMSGVTPSVANMYLTSVNARIYPYLQLTLYSKDTVTKPHTPSQMKKWQVFFTPVPEVAVNPSIYSYFHSDSLQAGDSVNYRTVVQNISPYTMDSMLYNTWIVDAGNAIHNLPVRYTKKLKPGDTALLTAKVPTIGYQGNNSLWINVNPQFLPQTRSEEYYFNNFARKNFHVIGDKINPLLDVTFNGIHILNNDIVSPHPSILIEVMDENKYLALNDTSDFAVYIRNVNTPVSQKVSFGPQMTFTPAVLPKNSCKIVYTPTLADGTYELSVQAKDRSSNLSGTNNYTIDFQVINKSMISSILNYPNPFSTSTRFVFTLTGEQIPTYFKIQIITVTGKLVREITEAEIGPIHIGTNITQYAWDGTDKFGDRLANGVYLYRVVSSVDGQSIDHYTTDADQYFTKGWGKMYLLR